MAEVITITSGKGGVGKSTATANIAVGLALSGQKVVAIDFDIGLRNLDMILGLENRIVYDVVDVMEGKCKLSQALIQDKKTPSLYFLPASQSKDKTILDKAKVKALIEELKADFDYILLDSPAGIEGGFEHAIFWADRALIVVTPEVSSVRDSDRVIGIIDAKSDKAAHGQKVQKHLIINRIKPELVESGQMLSSQDVLKILAIPLIGLVPEDEKVVSATNCGEPVIYDDKSISGECYKRIVRRIAGEEVEFVEFKTQGSILKTFKRLFK
ncbi:septum site-determining protein MinD [Helicobacter sp. CLO-3]|uniref:septum site-determining protein MinD n=1 Tax=unclassified Helicobacter TaxID=2593540 RepID=UPI000804B1CC|nr:MULTISPECIES: septum site-determining protein MinD [unclassified Helicobacter]OBV29862.1 septum site-determining protein MinD [Helicobacter sp. CLO-3]OHU84058.1 septum site-determining protein MinD [Helicobacter sp. CLO-3]